MTVVAPEKRSDIHTLPSGSRVDLLNFDAGAMRTLEDGHEALAILERKIIEIEFQIACHKQGYHTDGAPFTPERPPDAIWMPRASKALGWARLQKSRVTQRLASLARIGSDRVAQQTARERAFIDIAKTILPADQFQQIMLAAIAVAAKGDPT